MKSVSDIRALGRNWLLAYTGLTALASVVTCHMLDGPTELIAIGAIALAICSIGCLRKVQSATRRALFAVFVQGQVAIFVAAFAGHDWQADAHMLFFATMGILILLVDYRAIVAGAGAVAVHHLALNFAMPELVYPGGSDLGRTVMHAVILILSTAALSFCSWALARLSADAAATEVQREDMIDQLSSSIGVVVDQGANGDFSGRLESQFDDPRLQQIVEGTNKLIETVDHGVFQTSGVMAQIANGDFTASMEGAFAGGFADLQTQISATTEQMSKVVSNIESVSGLISTEAQEIATGSQTLSDQATGQAASIEETSASLQTLTETVKSYDASIQNMSSQAAQSLQQGRVGQETVKNATSAMAAMTASAKRINEVVTMMSEISFQTNLLALNASVEAARAGDAGKGFAVVAQEVRALAQRSADSEDEIRQLISESSQSVETGVRFVDELGVTLGDILRSVEEVAKMASDMTEITTDQVMYMNEISSNVAGIDQTTQNTALTAESYLNHARSLQQHSEMLKQLMSTFHVDAGSTSDAGPQMASAA